MGVQKRKEEGKINKKGNYPDIVEYIKVAFALMLTLVIVLTIYSGFNDNVQADINNTVFTNASQTASANLMSSSYTYWDIFFPLLLLAFVCFSVVMARLIPSSPKFVITSIFALIILPFGAMILENIWDSLNTGQIAITTANMMFMPFLMNNLTLVTLLYSVIVATALLTKTGTEGYAG
tara:strand:+ start:3520 stop:4056 length:537 start_codon:yes stop_codon:yes gene_type:complete